VTVIRSGTWLDEQEFPPPVWVVPGLIPEGCCILAGHPKIGKSFLVLGTALAVAAGEEVLGVAVDQRPVLYLALEDSESRIQKRCRQLLNDGPLPVEFYFVSRTHQSQAVAVAQEWVREHSGRGPLVIVDTLEKIRGERGMNAYRDDYQAGGLLQTMEGRGGAVIAVHHSRKGASEDFLDEVSGTLGLAGSVDTIITLKRKRTAAAAELSVTGRDVEEMVYSVNFMDGRWHAADGSLSAAASKSAEPQLSEKMNAVLELVNSRECTSSSDVVGSLPEVNASTARQYLTRLTDTGMIRRMATGIYGPVTLSRV